MFLQYADFFSPHDKTIQRELDLKFKTIILNLVCSCL